MEGARPAACGRAEGAVGALRRRVRKGLRARRPAFLRTGGAAQGGAQAARGVHRGGGGARADAARRAARLARDRALAARNGCTDGARAMLGSVEPRAWKKLDAQLKAALAPLRDALSAARDARESRARGADRGGHGAGGEGDGARRAVAGQGNSGPVAGAGEGTRRWRSATSARYGNSSAPPATRYSGRAKPSARRRTNGRAKVAARWRRFACSSSSWHSAPDKGEQDLRRALRELQEQWKQKTARPRPGAQGPGIPLHQGEIGGGNRTFGASASP